MPARRIKWLLGLVAGQAALLWATFQVPRFGADLWQYWASLVVALAVAGLFRHPLARSRRFLAMGVLAFTVLATASGFWLLYWKEGLRVDGLQDWGRLWHVLWSWFAMVFFFQHTWINRRALAGFFRRSMRRRPAAVLHVGAYVAVVVALVVTWSSLGRDWFTNENYIALSLYTWLVATVPPYTLWAGVRWQLATARPAWVTTVFRRARVRGAVDLALVPIAALAVASGIPLTFMDDLMDAWGLKYVSKYWHVWPSVLFAVLVFAHALHAWRQMRRHWRSYGVILGDLAPDETQRGRSGPSSPRKVAAGRRGR